MKFIALGALALVALGLVPAAVVGAFGRNFLYHPTDVTDEQLSELARLPGWQKVELSSTEATGGSDQIVIKGLFRPAASPSAPWVVIFGGNAWSIDTAQTVLNMMGETEDWGLVAFSYRGYDASTGEPTQAGILSDARLIVDHLSMAHDVKPESLVLVGQSLGSGVASHLAASLSTGGHPPKGLILLSPYTSMSAVFQGQAPVPVPIGFAVRDSYRTDKLIGDVACPVLLLHGDQDTLIPIEHSHTLAAALGDKAQLVTLTGQGHNGLWGDERTAESARGFIKGLER